MQALLFCPFADESAVLAVVLQQAGFTVRSIRNLDQAIAQWPEQPSELIMLALPNKQQATTQQISMLRAQTLSSIITITEQIPEEMHIEWLESGADLVINRPYSVRILLAEIKALMRRTAGMPFFSLPTLTQSNLVLDPSMRTVQVAKNDPIHLTQLEFRLLYTLMTHVGQIIPTGNIVEHVWGYSGEGNQELVRGLIKRLRTKIEPDQKSPNYILTEPGIGYYFNRFTDEKKLENRS